MKIIFVIVELRNSCATGFSQTFIMVKKNTIMPGVLSIVTMQYTCDVYKNYDFVVVALLVAFKVFHTRFFWRVEIHHGD